MTLTKDWLKKFDWPETLLTGHPLAIAHRGASDYAPENTLKAFRIAADLCAEMWELDLRLSADGVCVVSHDDDLSRISGRELLISKSSWAEISAVQLAEGQRILRFEDVIALAENSGCGLYVDIKSEGAGRAAWRVLQKANFRFAVLGSFVVDWISDLRDMGCEYPLAVLIPANSDPLEYINGVSVDVIHICWRGALARPDQLLTDQLFTNLQGYQIVLWDEDRVSVLAGIWDKPVMGICSNRPEMLKPYKRDTVNPVDIVCHRGANILAPENTLGAAKICLDQGFQFIEIDVRSTSDGALAVIHDANLKRTTNGHGSVADHTLAQIQALDAGGWFRDGTVGYAVPSLDQVFDLAKGRAGIYVEIKQAQAEAVLKVAQAKNILDNCFFWSSDIKLLHWLRDQSPEIMLMAPRWKFSSVAQAIDAYGAQIVEFDVEKDDLSEINQCQALGVRSMIFSTRSGWDELSSYLQYKPDMVNLDYPDRFKILTSYPNVRRHFVAMGNARIS